MVWATPEPVDDSAAGIDCVRAKPLKKRCGFRTGLSRYYSSKSQSFSSLDLVQCTPFGTSARALAKRPSSFDLRRSSPRATGGFGPSQVSSSAIRSGCGGGVGSCERVMAAATEGAEDDRCPCNDTIFADPSEAFMSPEGSPSASPLQMYDSYCSLSSAGMVPYLQQRQFQLTNEYLTHLSVLLPLHPNAPSPSGGGCGGLSHAFSGSFRSTSSCGSGAFGQGCSSSSSSSAAASSSDTVMTAAARMWQPAATHLAAASCSGGGLVLDAGSGLARQQPQQTAYAGAPGAAVEAGGGALSALLRSSCSGGQRSPAVRQQQRSRLPSSPDASSAAQHPFACQNTCTGGGATGDSTAAASGGGGGFYHNRPRNCLSAGGFVAPALGCGGFVNGGASMAAPATAVAPMAAVTPCAAGAGGGGGAASLGRKSNLSLRRLRVTQGGATGGLGPSRHAPAATAAAAEGLWGLTEELIAGLTLNERQQQLSHRQDPASPSRPSLTLSTSLGGGSGDAAATSGCFCAGADLPFEQQTSRCCQQQEEQQKQAARSAGELDVRGFERVECLGASRGATATITVGLFESAPRNAAAADWGAQGSCCGAGGAPGKYGQRQYAPPHAHQLMLCPGQPQPQQLCGSAPSASFASFD